MENATKALLIAGTVLIAIIMISIAVYLYSMYSNQSKEYNTLISSIEIEKFNSKFEVFVGRNDITPQEIVSAVNLSREYNNQIKIFLGSLEISYTSAEEFMKNNINDSFSCTWSVTNPEYDENGKITKITFTKN